MGTMNIDALKRPSAINFAAGHDNFFVKYQVMITLDCCDIEIRQVYAVFASEGTRNKTIIHKNTYFVHFG